MTNAQIIFNQSVKLMQDGVIGSTGRTITIETPAGERVEIPEPEALHTYAIWKQYGRQVKRGEKARAKIAIWKHASGTREVETTTASGDTETVEVDASRMFMKIAFFFTLDQTEPVAE